MLNFLWMLLAFAVLTGIAMVFYTHGRYSSVEGLLLAMGTVILVLLAAGAAQAFSIGFIVLLVLGGYGLLSFLLGKKQPLLSRRNFRRRDFFSPGYVLILAGFLYAVIAFEMCIRDSVRQRCKPVTAEADNVLFKSRHADQPLSLIHI